MNKKITMLVCLSTNACFSSLAWCSSFNHFEEEIANGCWAYQRYLSSRISRLSYLGPLVSPRWPFSAARQFVAIVEHLGAFGSPKIDAPPSSNHRPSSNFGGCDHSIVVAPSIDCPKFETCFACRSTSHQGGLGRLRFDLFWRDDA